MLGDDSLLREFNEKILEACHTNYTTLVLMYLGKNLSIDGTRCGKLNRNKLTIAEVGTLHTALMAASTH